MEEATNLLKDIIVDLAKDTVSFIVDKAKKHFIEISNKDQIDVGTAYEEYLTRVHDTYSKSKSFIYASEERELSSFFQPIDLHDESNNYGLRYNSGKKDTDYVSTENLNDVFARGSKLLITGSGGTGKTILMKYFCVNSIKDINKIPVLISLRWFNNEPIDEKAPLENLIYDQLTLFNFRLPYEYFLYSLEGSRYLFLFDGFDEIKQENISKLFHKISDFTKKYGDNYFIISSRQDERVLGLSEYKLLTIAPLTFKKVKGLISKLDLGHSFKSRFLRELRSEKNRKYDSFISVPLLLSILFITYVEKTTIPETLNEFYEEAFSTMLYRHDRRKEGFERVLKSGLRFDQFRDVFVWFCFRTYFNEDYSFSENKLIEYINKSEMKFSLDGDPYKYADDLERIACMIIRDGREYIFVHRSFQEYFAAYYVSKGSDKQQRKLLMELFKPYYRSLPVRSVKISKAYCGFDVNSFLGLLNSIEPDNMMYNLLWPHVEKVYAIYQESKEDLLITASKLFTIIKSLALKEPQYSLVPNKEILDNLDCFILEKYVFSMAESEYLKQLAKNKTNKPDQFENVIPVVVSDMPAKFFYYDHVDSSLDRSIIRAIDYVLAAIKKYKLLYPKSGESSSFDDFLEQY